MAAQGLGDFQARRQHQGNLLEPEQHPSERLRAGRHSQQGPEPSHPARERHHRAQAGRQVRHTHIGQGGAAHGQQVRTVAGRGGQEGKNSAG